jgi:hypothetical protein
MPIQPGLGGVDPAQANSLQGSPAQAPFDLTKQISGAYSQAQAQHSNLMESYKRLDVVRTALDSLVELQDSATPEDVIKSAGSMVGAGFSPAALAKLLSSMPPQGGQALQSWIQQQDQQARQAEEGLKEPLLQSKLRLGGAAMAQLHVNHVRAKAGPAQAQMPGTGPSGPVNSMQPQPQEA